MFRIPDSILEELGLEFIDPLKKLDEDINKLETFFDKYNVKSYMGWEYTPEGTRYFKLIAQRKALKKELE